MRFKQTADYACGSSVLLHLHHLRRQRVLIGARLVVEALAEAPGGHLEVERDRAVVGYGEAARLGEDFAALLVVDRGERLVDERVERRIGIAARVAEAAALVLARRREQRAQRARHFPGIRAPAGEPEAELAPVALGEEGALGHGVEQ